jgi:hypothetical protein
MIVKLKESVNNSISFSDSYNVFSYEDIPFVKKEAIDIWTSLPVGYALRVRNDNAVYIFEKTSEGMLRHEISKVIRTTTTKNHGNLRYTDYRTEKPYAVDSKYERDNLKNTISHDTASLKIIDDRGQVVSHIKRDFFLEHRPELTEAAASQPKTLIVCPSCKAPAGNLIFTDRAGYADYDEYLRQPCECKKCGCIFEANFREVTDYSIISYGSLDN